MSEVTDNAVFDDLDFSRVSSWREHRYVGGPPTARLKRMQIAHVSFDHIIPLSRGGPHTLNNLQPAHFACNSRKGDR